MEAYLHSLFLYIHAEPLVTTLTLVVAILVIFSITLSLRVSRLTRGSNGKSLEGTIGALGERTSALESYARNNQATVKHMEARLARAVQGVAAVRFDPFKQQGGQQSFSTAFLNERGDGVVMSGIHSRDQVRVYAKPVQKFASPHDLSAEEKQAIQNAQTNLTS